MARKQETAPPLRPRVKGVTRDVRPHINAPSKMQTEAGNKQYRLMEAVRKVKPGAWSSMRHGTVQILYPDSSLPAKGTFTLLVNGSPLVFNEYPQVVLAEADPEWKLGSAFDLPAWQAAYKLTAGAKA